MQEILEFSEIEIPEKNPNPVNDIYKKNGAEGAVSALVGLLLISILMACVGVVYLFFTVNGIVTKGGESVLYWGVFLFLGGTYVNILWAKVNVRDIYRACGYRKKIIKNGTAYPGVVTQVADYRTRCGTARFGALKVQEYSIQVKYSDTDCWVSGLETDPQKCLENPYCTVYVWKGKVIATDFKVRKEYIAPNGKTHLIAPRKKVMRK